ncbi:1-phosphofructokinase [Haloferacaceae archaeon DSL9]
MILTVTPNPAIDHTVELSDPLTQSHVHRADAARFDAGGKGINVSQLLHALEVDTAATGFLGETFGSFIRDRLADAAIESAFVDVAGDTRINTTVLAADERYKINHRGPRIDDAAVAALLERISEIDPATVVVAGSLPPGGDAGLIDAIAAAGSWDVVVDVSGELLRGVSERYALCKPNREELAAATGMAVETVPACLDAAEQLRARGFDRVVASLGADGAAMVTPSETLYAPAVETDVVDTVGAGDALLAGVLAALDRGESERAALRLGIAVATRVTEVPGTSVESVETLGDESEVDLVSR